MKLRKADVQLLWLKEREKMFLDIIIYLFTRKSGS